MSLTCTCARMCAPVCMCVRVCACVHMCVINENKHPFQDFLLLINRILLIYQLDFSNFCHMGLSSSILCASDLAKRGVSDHAKS